MRYDLKDVTIKLNSNSIIEVEFNKDATELTFDGLDEINSTLKKIYSSDDTPKAVLAIMPSFYIKKDILKASNSASLTQYEVIAIVAKSFASRLVGDIALKINKRIMIAKKEVVKPVKMFGDRETAYQWLLEELDKLKE